MNVYFCRVFVLMGVTSLTGCATATPNAVILARMANQTLALPSTSIQAVSDINKADSGLTGRAFVSFSAFTEKGQRFFCTTEMSAAITPWSPSKYAPVQCQPG